MPLRARQCQGPRHSSIKLLARRLWHGLRTLGYPQQPQTKTPLEPPGTQQCPDGDDPSDGAVDDDELRDAVLSMADDELISHDIWFVALGASNIDHAGMKAFLGKHRAAIRGAFLINLDCVGAGNLSALSREGLLNVRRADRRLMRLLSGTASDLHIPLTQVSYDQGTTDATSAMKQSVRAITLVGIGDTGMPALSHTAADTLENVDADQAALVAELVTEMIRRS